MEWGRAKTILILSFICLNFLLGYQLWLSKADYGPSSQAASDIAKEFEQMLKDKNIVIRTNVPAETPRMREIAFRFLAMAKPDEPRKLSPPIRTSALLSKADIKAELAKHLIDAESYELDPAAGTEEDRKKALPGVIVMNQLHDGYPIFHVRLELYYTNQSIHAYTQARAEVQASHDPRQKVLPAMTAIGTLADKYLQPGTIITDIRLGYHGQIYNSETQVLAPYWRIATQSGDLYYVHAINGGVEGPPKETGNGHKI